MEPPTGEGPPLLRSPLGPAAIPEGAGPSSSDPDDDLDALVDQLLGSKPRPVDWRLLTGQDAARHWADLDAWVRWLVTRYGIDPREIPPCWAAHGELVEELSALHTAHQAAFDPAGAPTGPADWHTVFANARARLHTSVARTGCRAGEHRNPAIADWVALQPLGPSNEGGVRPKLA